MSKRYSNVLRWAAPKIVEHPRGLAVLRLLAQYERWQDEPDGGFGTADALYWLGADWHSGQGCPLYSVCSRLEGEPIRFRLSISARMPENGDLWQELCHLMGQKGGG